MITGSFLVAACGSSPGAENDGSESANQAITISPIHLPFDCETVAPNASVNIGTSGDWNDADIAAPYGSIFCPGGFVVQVTGAYAAEIGGVVTAQVAPAKAASEAACSSTSARSRSTAPTARRGRPRDLVGRREMGERDRRHAHRERAVTTARER